MDSTIREAYVITMSKDTPTYIVNAIQRLIEDDPLAIREQIPNDE